MGAVPESQVRQFIEKLVGPVGAGAAAEMLQAAEAAAEAGDAASAMELYAAVLGEEPDNLKAVAGVAKLRLDLGDIEGARQALAMAPPDKAEDPALAGVRAAIDLAEQAASLGTSARSSRPSPPTPRTIRPASTSRWRSTPATGARRRSTSWSPS